MKEKIVFLLGLLAAASGFASPPIALALGLIFGLAFPHPYASGARKLSRWLLQASVVGLGFGMNLHEVIRVGRTGFLYTLLSITFTMFAGMALAAAALSLRRRTVPYLLAPLVCVGPERSHITPITMSSAPTAREE